MNATRRQVLAGAAAGSVPVLLGARAPGSASAAGLDPAGPRASAPPVLRGRALAVAAGGRRVVVAHEQRRTVGVPGRHAAIDVGGRTHDVALRSDGALAVATTASWDEPGLAFVDPVEGRTLARLDVGPAPGAVVFTPSGGLVVVAGGEQEGTLTVVDAARRTVLRTVPVGRVPRGLALAPDGRTAYVALQADDRVRRIDLRTGRVVGAFAVPELPDRLALDAAGRRLLLTHAAREVTHVTELDLVTRRRRRRIAGPLPADVAWTRDGRALVALGGAARVVDLRRRRRHDAGPAPRGLAVVGRRFWTVSGLTGAVTRGRA